MEGRKIRILVVDDERDIVEFLRYNLEKEGYETIAAFNGKDAISETERVEPDLILLDVMMPEMDGFEVCRRIRSKAAFEDTKILFLTAKNNDLAQIEGFDTGADDFISKPIKLAILVSRIKAVLRRFPKEPAVNKLVERNIEIDMEKFEVRQDGRLIYLPKKEFELLTLLISKPGKVFKRSEIFNTVWGPDVIVTDRTIDVHIRKLREKIGNHYIKTVKGIGYKFSESDSE